jgi:hypothetical protein
MHTIFIWANKTVHNEYGTHGKQANEKGSKAPHIRGK